MAPLLLPVDRRRRAEARVTPALDDDIRALFDAARGWPVPRDGGQRESDHLADLRHPAAERRAEAAIRADRAGPLTGLARAAAAVHPLARAAVPRAVDVREVPLI